MLIVAIRGGGLGSSRLVIYRNEDGSGDGNERSYRDSDEDRIEEGGREAKMRKKSHKSCRRHVGNGADLGGTRKKCRKEGLVQ